MLDAQRLANILTLGRGLLTVVVLALLLPWLAAPAEAAYSKRYSTVASGGLTYTGNTLGLSKATNSNAPGTNGAIGAFITTNSAVRDGTYPFGTTASWLANASSAPLRLPAGSSILYAELIWGGSYNYGGENVSASLGNAVTLSTPFGSYSVSPSPTTAITLTGDNYYVRSADVTTMVQAAGAGTYTVGGVPGTQGNNENNANAAGWVLAVAYANSTLPVRNLTIFVGGELTSSATTTTSSVSGFCTPQSGTISARLLVSAIEGDSDITGDQMQVGATVGTLAAVSGPNNPLNNFFTSQLNSDAGTLDTAGSFGSSNHTPGSNGSGRRQGWDITNVDVSSRMQNGQNSAFARGTTSGDRYILNSIGLQINVGAPIFPTSVMTVDKAQTYVGDTLTFTVRMDNSAGSADALNAVYTNIPADGTSFIPGTFKVNGVTQASADPTKGVAIGTVKAGSIVTVTFQVRVNALPLYPAPAQYQNNSSWTYQFSSCAGFPLNNGTLTTAAYPAVVVPRLEPTKSANPSGGVLPGGTVTYTITIPNNGTANSSGTTLADPIPTGTIYVPGSTTLNGIAVADVAGAMPFATARTVNSSGAPAGQINVGASAVVSFRVTIAPSPPLIITNIATIDPDGAGPVAAIVVPLTNPPVSADLAVAVSDNQTSAIAGNPISYAVTVTNNGPDPVISLNLAVSLPASLQNPLFSAASGSYDRNATTWTGLNLAAGQTVVLTVSGTVAADAGGTLTLGATVAPSPGVSDSNSANNTASDSDTISYVADLAISKSDGKSSVSPGAATTYTITVSNNGPSRVQSVSVVDTLPSALQNPLFTPSQGIYNEVTGAWTGLNLLPGGSVTLTLGATVDPLFRGTLVNSVSVAPPSGVTDPVAANNSASDSNTTTPQITITKAVDKAAALPGEVLTYSVHYRNVGGGAARNLMIMDTIPLHTTYVTGSLRSGSGSSNYATATVKSDAVGDDEAEINEENITFKFNDVAPDDGVANGGADEGIVYFKVSIK